MGVPVNCASHPERDERADEPAVIIPFPPRAPAPELPRPPAAGLKVSFLEGDYWTVRPFATLTIAQRFQLLRAVVNSPKPIQDRLLIEGYWHCFICCHSKPLTQDDTCPECGSAMLSIPGVTQT